MAIQEISVRDLAQLGTGARVLDVREVDEFAAGHVAHAVNIPLGTVPDHLADFDGQPLYVICKSGGRSFAACEFLAGHGHDASNVAGGMIAWADAGLDVVHES